MSGGRYQGSRGSDGRYRGGDGSRGRRGGRGGGGIAGRGGGGSAGPPLLNGQKGAEVHTVSEGDRIRFTQLLVQFRENMGGTDAPDFLTLPTNLTNTERKFVHHLSGQLGLKSKSSGKGEARRITISRPLEIRKVAGSAGGGGGPGEGGGDEQLPHLDVGRQGIEALRRHVRRHPPTAVEMAESRQTGSSLLGSAMGGGAVNESGKGGGPAGAVGGAQGEDGDLAEAEGTNILQVLDELRVSSQSEPRRLAAPRARVDMGKRAKLYWAAQASKERNAACRRMQASRRNLPAHAYAKIVCDTVLSSRVTILSGATGCGKSTQLPQFLLDDDRIGPAASIIVTQPRRISAISVAERIAAERGEECGKGGSLVGYSVRLEGRTCPSTQLLFVTPGVLLRRFQSSPDLAGVTHVVIDEIHERDKYTDFLMIALRSLVALRDDLHIILMSATIQTNELSIYWSGVGSLVLDNTPTESDAMEEDGPGAYGADVPSDVPAEVSIPGRTFPVQEFFLEDILEMTGFVNDDGMRLGDQSELSRIDAELGKLLGSIGDTQEKGRGRKRKGPSQHSAPTIGDGLSLTCVMCGRIGFRSAEELGDHVALCDGGGGITMEALEEKVRAFDDTPVAALAVDGIVAAEQFEDYEDFEEEGIQDDNNDNENEDEVPGLHRGKWDGESPFGVVDVVSTTTTTLTQEEMLSRYQSVHDDEQINFLLLLEIVQFICQSSYGDGAILVFFPGWGEISEFMLLLESTVPFNNKAKYSVLPLHSGIPSQEQRRVFQRPAKGTRKIVLATNIAETSITIDDVAFVIDTGRAKEKNYDPHLNTSTLQPVWISQASAKQRRGRAGRTKAGVCFHMFSRRRHDSFRPFLESELLRTPLEEMCLQCKKLNLAPGGPEDEDGIPSFLSKALTPPHSKAVTNAIELLVELGAMEAETNDLTDLGLCLSVLSLEPTVGKMVIWSHLLGCTKAACAMAVAMSYKSPFILPPPFMRKAADEVKIALSKGSESDQITVLNVLRVKDDLSRKGRAGGSFFDFCRRNFLGPSTMGMIGDLRRNISRELSSLGFLPSTDGGYHNRNGDSGPEFLQATIAAGLYPNIASRRKGEANFSTVTNRKAKVHISSVNACKGQPLNGKCQVGEGEVEFIVYGEMVRGVSSFTMNQTTHLTSPLPLILLCGNLRVRPADLEQNDIGNVVGKSVLSVDDWILFLSSTEVASNLVVLRRRLNNAFWHLVANPALGLSKLGSAEKDAVETLGLVLRSSHKAHAR